MSFAAAPAFGRRRGGRQFFDRIAAVGPSRFPEYSYPERGRENFVCLCERAFSAVFFIYQRFRYQFALHTSLSVCVNAHSAAKY